MLNWFSKFQIFSDGIHGIFQKEEDSPWSTKRKYLVSPIDGTLKYHRIGKQESHEIGVPLERASLVLSDVSLTISEVL